MDDPLRPVLNDDTRVRETTCSWSSQLRWDGRWNSWSRRSLRLALVPGEFATAIVRDRRTREVLEATVTRLPRMARRRTRGAGTGKSAAGRQRPGTCEASALEEGEKILTSACLGACLGACPTPTDG